MNFPVECLEDIFRHLLERELITCTLVSPSWNDFIGSTVSCMEKVNLSCKGPAGLENLKKLLSISKRKYTCLEIEKNSYEEVRELLSLLNERTWTSITAAFCFKTVSDFFEFLKSRESGVRKLDLNRCHLRSQNDPENGCFDLQFP